jgi:hypothetical protein
MRTVFVAVVGLVAVAVLVVHGIVGCAAVPSLIFTDPDAATLDAAPPTTDAPTADADDANDADAARLDAMALDTGREAGDAGADGASADGTSEAGCPGSVPDGATVCCGSVACDLSCMAPQCTMCEQTCTPAQLCCARNNSVNCVNPAMGCH